jgi:hypothetical protein
MTLRPALATGALQGHINPIIPSGQPVAHLTNIRLTIRWVSHYPAKRADKVHSVEGDNEVEDEDEDEDDLLDDIAIGMQSGMGLADDDDMLEDKDVPTSAGELVLSDVDRELS